MGPCFYLLFSPDGDLAGLERLTPRDAAQARGYAARLLGANPDAASVEIWREGRQVEAFRSGAGAPGVDARA